MGNISRAGKRPLDWLLEPDSVGVRYLAMRDIVKAGGKELAKAQKAARQMGHFTRSTFTAKGVK